MRNSRRPSRCIGKVKVVFVWCLHAAPQIAESCGGREWDVSSNDKMGAWDCFGGGVASGVESDV